MDAAAQAAALLRQGSVIDFNLTSWMADPSAPLHEQTVATVGEANADPEDEAINVNAVLGDYSMVVSQSCDLARTRTDRYWATICPIVLLPREAADVEGIRQGNARRYVPLPWHPDSQEQEWFADLHLMHTIERSLLVGVNELARPSEQQRRILAERLGQYLSRPALPPEVDRYLKPLKKRATSKHGRESSADGVALAAVSEIRLGSAPDFDAAPPWALELIFVIAREALPDDPQPAVSHTIFRRPREPVERLAKAISQGRRTTDPTWEEMWRGTVNGWIDALPLTDEVTTKPEFRLVTALTPDEYRTTDVVDLTHLSETGN